ncbi:MAG: HAMP domain-containing histidine kinase [Proteobacteria bacterium]|jgi:signal transduction histidine kinase|nr:HAMP domain-containing histidine kinase [Pseudomonadota bacterium]
MKIRTKILLLLILGVLVPLLLSHHFIAKQTKATMARLVEQDLAGEATRIAGSVGARLSWAAEALRLVVRSVPFESFTREEVKSALALPYRQLSDATLVALLDESGRAVAEPYRPGDEEAALLGRAPVSDRDVEVFSRNVPHGLALTAQIAFGPAYRSDEGEPRMVAAASFPVAGGSKRWVLAVELSMLGVCETVVRPGDETGKTCLLVDARGYSICSPKEEEWRPLSDAAAFLGIEAKSVAKRSAAAGTQLRAADEVAVTGWRVVVQQSEEAVMEPVTRSTRWILMWTGIVLVIAVVGGVFLSRGLTGPLAELEQASQKLAAGAYEHVLPVRSEDEVGNLARSFNRMTAEIRAWNAELKSRVEARTRELKEAQLQVLRSQKLAAVGELGAGVAHEINNPLTGVLGLAQLARAEAEPGSELAATLDQIAANARRVAEVVDVLLRFSQTQVSPDMSPVEPRRVLEQTIAMYANRLVERGIRVEWRVEPDCTVPAVEGDLRIAFGHLVDNAVRAMPRGGHLGLSVGRVEGGAVRIAVSDDGIGMSEETLLRAADPFFTTEPPGSGSRGLGLWIASSVAEEHGGRIVMESAVGRGTTATMYFPGKVRISKA